MKVLTASLSTTRDELLRMFTSDLSVKAIVIKGTDIIITKESWAMYAYSRKLILNGSAEIRAYNDVLFKYGYTYHIGLFNVSDWKYLVDTANRTKFSKNTHDIVLLARKMLKEILTEKPEQKYPEYGVELEVESDGSFNRQTVQDVDSKGLIHDIGGDCSVYGGTEIRFNHPTLNKWKLQDISVILNKCKEIGGYTDKGTAGMHIHISRADIRTITDRFMENISTMQDILYPINCRKKLKYNGDRVHYGVGDNIYRNQNAEFGTLEIRAWNATLDPKLFLARIKFCKTFTNWLAKTTEITVDSFFKFMNKSEKENYKYMLNHTENPHEWGFPAKAVRALLV